MKRLLFVTILCFVFANARTQNSSVQFSNSGFEQWSTNSSPQSWNSIAYTGYNLCDISKSTSHVGGDFSLQMKPKQLPSFLAGLLGISQFNVPGFITNGTIDVMTLMSSVTLLSDYENMDMSDYMSLLQTLKDVLTDGLRISALPEAINGYYDFSPLSSNDVLMVFAYTTGTVAASLAITGGGVFYANAQTDGFESFSIPMNYISDNAEELYLVGLVLNMDNEATEFGSANLDDISIVYSSSVCDVVSKTEEDILVFPNPAKNGFSLNTKDKERVEIFDLMGRRVREIRDYSPNTPIYMEEKGTYIVKVADKNLKVVVE